MQLYPTWLTSYSDWLTDHQWRSVHASSPLIIVLTRCLGWQLFNAVLGWNNTATLGSVLTYIFYWFCIVATLVYLKWEEGRVSFLGYSSKAYKSKHAAKDGLDSPPSGYAETPGLEEKKVYEVSDPSRDVPILELK